MFYVVCHVDVQVKMDYESDSDISWLTQSNTVENTQPIFDVGYSFIEEELVGKGDVVSLEEVVSDTVTEGSKILYDNVVVEDISSDENVDNM